MVLASCMLFGISFLLYRHTISFSYVNLDDNILIEESQFYLKNPGNIFSVFKRGVFSSLGETNGLFYRPMLSVSFIIDSFFSKNQPSFSHLTNIFLHGIAAVLLFYFLLIITSEKLRSFILSLIFTVHPLGVAVATWLPGRNDSLLFIFVVASFISFVLFHNKNNVIYFILNIIFYFLSLLTKETAIMAPVLFLFYTLFVAKKKLFRREIAIFVLSWILLTTLFFYLRFSAMLNSSSYINAEMIRNLLNQLPGTFVYVSKIFIPFRLSIYSELKDFAVWPGIILFSFLIIYSIIFKRKNSVVLIFGILWFVMFLLPTYTMLENYSDGAIREHRAYLPYIGILLSISQINFKEIAFLKKIKYLMIFLILSGLSYLSYRHSFNFANEIAFWSNSVSVSPSSAVSYFQLGVAFTKQGNYEKAKEAYKEAILLRPVLPPGAYNNLGVIYLQKGKLNEAEELFEKELKLHPNLEKAKKNLELVREQQN